MPPWNCQSVGDDNAIFVFLVGISPVREACFSVPREIQRSFGQLPSELSEQGHGNVIFLFENQ